MDDKKNLIASIIIGLGFWQIAFPLTFGVKGQLLFINDIATGVLLIVFGLLSLAPFRIWSGFAAGLTGVWLQMAPLIFWAPNALTYVNETLVGAIAIILAFQCVKKEAVARESSVPAGWSYNPSSWPHRIPTVCLAALCWFFSRYMAAYQLGYIEQIWDPFFKDGTLDVITSQISKEFPVSDAGMGAMCYTLEALLGWQGSTNRWAKMPWLVACFAFLVIPVGIASISLIILQPVIVGSWCSWCLATAVSMLFMVVLTSGELAAVLQLLLQVKRKGKSVWKVFWKGDGILEKSSPAKPCSRPMRSIARGFTFPWNLVASVLLGIWLMVSPALLDIVGDLATSNYIFGPMIAAFSVIAFAEVFRGVRFLNLLFGLILIIAAWLAPGTSTWGLANNLGVGLMAIVFCFPRGRISERYGDWERLIF